MRLVGCLVVLVLIVPALSQADIVVLASGEQLDVESFEVRDAFIVITTWDGRLRSLPRAYVDMEATRAANDVPKPGQEIAPARLDKAKEACRAYGVAQRVSIYREVMDEQLRKLQSKMTIGAYDRLRAGFRSAFDEERSFDAVVAHFAQNANHDVLDSLVAWLSSPLAGRLIAMETADLGNREIDTAAQYYIKLRTNEEAYGRRLALMARLDEARRTTESVVDVVLLLLEAFVEAGRKVFPAEDIEFDPDSIREEVTPAVQDAVRDGMLVVYREASDADIDSYIEYWSSREGARVRDLMNAAVEAGARQSSEVAMEMVAGKRHAVP